MFSCRTRGFCPSSHAKRLEEWAEWMRETMDYLKFIARVTSHIPDKGQVMVRYYGLYVNAHIYRSLEADVCGGEAPAVPCLRAGRARGGRGERGIFLSIL